MAAKTIDSVLNEIVDYCYKEIVTDHTGDYVFMDDDETYEVLKGIAEILNYEFDNLKQAVYEYSSAIDMLRAQLTFEPLDKKEKHLLICETLGVNQFATKEELKQLIDQL